MAKIDTTVGKLVDMITDGDLRLPEMQPPIDVLEVEDEAPESYAACA